MNYLLSKEHFLAHEQTKEDYKNLICHYADFKLYRKGTAQSHKAKNNCYKYLISIIVNKNILKIDTTADEFMLDELFDRIK
jgi:bisphosphoglycerate-dependent phosphoglycerate mutase